MQNYTKGKQSNYNKIEAIKNKLNASEIIRNDFFSHSHYKPQQSQSYYNNPIRSEYKNQQPTHVANYDGLKDRVQKEVNRGLALETEKKEMELMIQDQVESQSQLRNDYGREIDSINGEIEHMQQVGDDLQREMGHNKDKASKVEGVNADLEAEINEMLDDNKLLKNELARLGEKTNEKMTEMQGKMQNNLGDLERLKEKHANELQKQNDIQSDKIKRLEEDYNKKMMALGDKYNSMIINKQNAESELGRLQDAKKRAENELENKIRIIKEQYYEDEFNQFKGIMKIHNNRLRTAVDNKDQLTRKQERMMQDYDELNQEVKDHESAIHDENQGLIEDINNLKEDVANLQKEIEEHKSEEFNVESDIQRLSADIQKTKFQFKQVTDTGRYRIKEMMEKYKYEMEEMQNKVENNKMKTKELESDLEQVRARHRETEKHNQRIIENMKSKLNNNIFNTINEYKGINSSYNGGNEGKMQRSYMSHYLN